VSAMSLEHVIAVSPLRTASTLEDVARLEHDLGVTLPPGYAEFVTTLGEGTFCDSLQVKLPATIRRDLPESRARWAEYWFWDEDVLTQADAGEAVVIADTDTGDEIVVHPRRPGQILVLPRDSDDVVDAGATLDDLLDWYCTSGLVATPVSVRWFMSWAGRTVHQSWRSGDPDQIRANVLALDLHTAYEDLEDGATRFVMPAIGGTALLITESGGLVSLRYDADLGGESVTALTGALAAAGAEAGAPSGAVD
jgi:hypothetical protein